MELQQIDTFHVLPACETAKRMIEVALVGNHPIWFKPESSDDYPKWTGYDLQRLSPGQRQVADAWRKKFPGDNADGIEAAAHLAGLCRSALADLAALAGIACPPGGGATYMIAEINPVSLVDYVLPPPSESGATVIARVLAAREKLATVGHELDPPAAKLLEMWCSAVHPTEGMKGLVMEMARSIEAMSRNGGPIITRLSLAEAISYSRHQPERPTVEISTGQKAAATRRIKKRAAEWRKGTRPDAGDVAAQLAEYIDRETAPNNYSRPAHSAEALLWHQLERLAEALSRLGRRVNGKRDHGWIGAIRLRRTALAALLETLAGQDIAPTPVSEYAIKPGDMLLHGGDLVRVVEKVANLDTGTVFTLEGGAVVKCRDRDELPALRPADFRVWNEERDRREAEKREADSTAYREAVHAFDDAYMAAWQARDWPAVRGAISAFHTATAGLPRNWYGRPRRNIVERIAMLRELPQPYDRKTGNPHSRRGGFKRHMQTERAVLQHLAWLRALPGFDFADPRTSLPARSIWGEEIRICAASLQEPGTFVNKTNKAGQVTSRSGSIQRDWIAEVLPERVRKGRRKPEPIAVAPTVDAQRESEPAVAQEPMEPVEALIEASGEEETWICSKSGCDSHRRTSLPMPGKCRECDGISFYARSKYSGAEAPPVDIEVNAPAPADPIAELADRIAALEARVTALDAATPIEATARPKRTPAHERAIRRAWAERKRAKHFKVMHDRDLRQAKDDRLAERHIAEKDARDAAEAHAAELARMRAERDQARQTADATEEALRDALASAERLKGHIDGLKQANHNLAGERDALQAKRRRAVLRARRWMGKAFGEIANYREEKRLHGETGWKRREATQRARRMVASARKAATFQRQRADVLHAHLAKLQADMADPMQPERASDITQLRRERDAARTAAAATDARNQALQAALDQAGDAIESLATRVARAEAAIRAAA